MGLIRVINTGRGSAGIAVYEGEERPKHYT
jgi:hypothetical protein